MSLPPLVLRSASAQSASVCTSKQFRYGLLTGSCPFRSAHSQAQKASTKKNDETYAKPTSGTYVTERHDRVKAVAQVDMFLDLHRPDEAEKLAIEHSRQTADPAPWNRLINYAMHEGRVARAIKVFNDVSCSNFDPHRS